MNFQLAMFTVSYLFTFFQFAKDVSSYANTPQQRIIILVIIIKIIIITCLGRAISEKIKRTEQYIDDSLIVN